jgi:hypothetical protein
MAMYMHSVHSEIATSAVLTGEDTAYSGYTTKSKSKAYTCAVHACSEQFLTQMGAPHTTMKQNKVSQAFSSIP